MCSSSVKNVIGSLIRFVLNLQIALGSIRIFTILILPICERGILLYLFVSSFISFTSVLQFSIYRSFVSLGKFIPKYFILFVLMMNGIVSLISLFFSLLVFRNARDLCINLIQLKQSTVLVKNDLKKRVKRKKRVPIVKSFH